MPAGMVMSAIKVEPGRFQQDVLMRLSMGFAVIVCSIESTGTCWMKCRLRYAEAPILVM